MIKTIAILGTGPAASMLAKAAAAKETDGYVFDIFDDNDKSLKKLQSAIANPKRKTNSVWFSQSYHNAAWGADIVVIDLPSSRIGKVLEEIEEAPNDRAIVTLTQSLSAPAHKAISARLRTMGLKEVTSGDKALRTIWTQSGIEIAAGSVFAASPQVSLKFDKK